jgi:hypothetical protein
MEQQGEGWPGLQFALPLIKQLLGVDLCIEDLCELDSCLHDRIMALRNLNAEQIEELGLDFTVDDVPFGKRRKINLLFGGETMLVTKGNVDAYTSLYAEYHLRTNARVLGAGMASAWNEMERGGALRTVPRQRYSIFVHFV